MDKNTNQSGSELGMEQVQVTNVNAPRTRGSVRAKIAATAFGISAAVASLLGGESTAEAKHPRHHPRTHLHAPLHPVHHKEKAPRAPKHNYQRFSHGGARLEIIEGSERAGLEGTPEIANKFNPLKGSDMPKIQAQCEFYDVWHAGIPLVRIRLEDLEKNVSPHFKVKDFVRIDPNWLHVVKPGMYQKHNGEYYRTIARVDPKIIDTIEEIVVLMEKDANKKRKKGSPRIRINLHVDEAYRPYGENARTYVWKNEHRKPGTPEESHPKSRHISGRGVDIDLIPGIEEAADRVLTRRGTGGLGTHGASIVHVDCRPEKYEKPWHYNKKKKESDSSSTKPHEKPIVAPKVLLKIKNPLVIDTPQSRKKLEGYSSIEQLIADKIVSRHAAEGYFYYGRSDEKLWAKKMSLIGRKVAARELPVEKFEHQKTQFLKKHPGKKLPARLAANLNRARASLEHFMTQYTASESAKKNALKEKSPNYAKADYREMIEKSLDTWVPKLRNTDFKPFIPYLNNPDLYHALHVQEIIPANYRDNKNKKVKLAESARVQLYRLLTYYKDPTKIPAVNDSVASFGIGQTTLDTYDGLKKLDIAGALRLPEFEDCTTFDCQMRRDIANTANNLNRFDQHVFSKHPHVKQLLEAASSHEQGLFLAAMIGAMHNGGPNIMRTAEVRLGKKLDIVKTLEQAGNLLLQNVSKPSARHYGNHVRGIYESLTVSQSDEIQSPEGIPRPRTETKAEPEVKPEFEKKIPRKKVLEKMKDEVSRRVRKLLRKIQTKAF